MIVRRPRLTSPRWPLLFAGATVAAWAWASGCAQRSLVEVDVVGDAPFQGVTLRLEAGGTRKDFSKASFTATVPYKAGLYLSDVAGASVTLVASARDGAGNCIGIGQANVAGPSAGDVAGPVSLKVSHTSVCTGGGGGTGGSNGGGSGGGSGGGTGSGGSSSGSGGSGAGGTNGGTGGTNGGTGGQSAGNLITNGDFANGEDSWSLPAMLGPVSHAVTNGAYCVTLGSAASVTIGYPAGATPPFQINGGASYRFSYQASASSGSVTFEAKVGQTQPPYDAVGSDWPGEGLGASLQTFSHTFTRGSTDSMMGVAFNVAGGPATVCIDNVSLTPN